MPPKETPEKMQQPAIEYPHVTTADVAREYWKSAKPYWISAVLIFVCYTVGVLSQSVIVPIYYKNFFDTVSKMQADPVNAVPVLITIILFVLLFNLIGWAVNRLASFLTVTFESKVMKKTRQLAFDNLMDHSTHFFTNNFTGSLVQRINRFSRSFERIFDRLSGDITPLVFKIVGAIVVLYFVQPVMAYGIAIWAFLFLILSYFFNRIKIKYDVQAAGMDSKLTGVISDSISNHDSVQLFSGSRYESDLVDSINSEVTKLNIFRWNLGNAIDAVQALLGVGIEFLVFYFGIKYWSMGTFSIGTFVLMQAYIITITGSLWGFGRIVRDVHESLADAKEMVEILHLPYEVQDKESAGKLKVTKGAIEFKDVSFTFGRTNEKNKQVFNNINVSIKPGEKVALIGPSGAGKSTMVKLLMRLYDIQGGEILIDTQNIADVTQSSLRNEISLVPQDPALFHRTLMENIRYGRRDASDEEVVAASKLAHCDQFIDGLPYKYETLVGERGIRLSGGERQRVAIARALLKNAPILVLDEATSSLDSHSESLIQDALQTLMKGKTVIVIAHRLSTIRNMDRIIVINKDGIAEEGTHDELLKKEGSVYAKLWSLQAGGFAGADASEKSIEELLEV